MLRSVLQFLVWETVKMVRGANSVKRQEWTRRLMRFGNSQLSVARFCQREGVSTASFYQWQRRLRSCPDKDDTESHDAPPVPHNTPFQELQFIDSRPLGTATTATALTVCLPGGIQLHVADNLPAIQTVVRELTGAAILRGVHEIPDGNPCSACQSPRARQ